MKKRKSVDKLLYTHIVAFLLLIFMTIRFGELRWSSMVVGFIVAYAVPTIIARLCLKGWSRRLCYLLLCVALLLSYGICSNLSTYVIEYGSFSNPALGTTDGARDFMAALQNRNTDNPFVVNPGYPMLMQLVFHLCGVNIFYPMLVNMMFTLGTIIIGGQLCCEAFPDKDSKMMLFRGAFVTALISSIIFYGTVLMKDAIVIFAFSSVACGMMQIIRKRLRIGGLIALAIGMLLLSWLKSPMGYFMLIGVVILLLTTKSRSTIVAGIVMVILSAGVCASGLWTRFTPDDILLTTENAEATTRYMFDYLPNTQRYAELIPDYYHSSMVERMLLLPLTSAAQYFPPFPWNFTRDLYMGGFYWYPHICIGWYIVGGLILAYIVLCLFRRFDGGLSRWATWFILCYMAVAYVSAGSVARYYLPFVPMAIPLVMNVLMSVEQGCIAKRTFKIYLSVYFTALIVGLVLAYCYLKM